jgi:hypothetical protein
MTATPETTTSLDIVDEAGKTPEQLLTDLGELHTRTCVSPLPRHPAAMGWQAATGSMAAGFARALHALNQVDPGKAREIAVWFDGPFGDAPDPEEHTDWLERNVAGSPDVLQRWVDDGRQMAEESKANTEDWERKQHQGAVQPISDAFPEGAAMVRLKTALAEFRTKGQANTLADDLDTAIRFVEFTRDDIRQLRKAWAAISGCLIKQGRHEYLTDADLADVPDSHRAFLLGRDVMRRDLLKVVEERNRLRDGGK